MVRRWLQFNGFTADAKEFDDRLKAILNQLRGWKKRACHDHPPSESTRVFSDSICEAFDDLTDEAARTADYLRQLAVMIQNKLELAKMGVVCFFELVLDQNLVVSEEIEADNIRSERPNMLLGLLDLKLHAKCITQ